MKPFRTISAAFVMALLLALPSIAKADLSLQQVTGEIYASHPEVPPAAWLEASTYYAQNPTLVTNLNYITVIDFDQPSTDYRMHVVDMHSGEVDSYLVAHGINTGDLYAEYFSNDENSDMSSLGLYLTGPSYVGEHGLSMRLFGEEASNSNAYIRDIVLHGADYVSEAFIQETGRLGRSDGCTAVELQYSTQLVNQLADGSVYLIYKSTQTN